MEWVVQEHGTVDILVNSAGVIFPARNVLDTTEEEWDMTIDVNLKGVFLMSKTVIPYMELKGRGSIVNISSVWGVVGAFGAAAYCASKGGVVMLTKAMAMEWAKYNIQVNGIGPGYFITEMNQPLADDPNFDAWIRKRTPAGRWGDPTELVGPMIFFASDASAFVTGQILYVDGGILTTL